VNVGKKEGFRRSIARYTSDGLFIKLACTVKTCLEEHRFFCRQEIHGRPCKPGNMQSIFHLSGLVDNQRKPPGSFWGPIMSEFIISEYPVLIKFF
jgi:hypothetical protein